MKFVAIYKNGYLFCTRPPLSDYYNEREKFTYARYIISDNVEYDLEDISSINQILIPDFSVPQITNTSGEFTLGVTGSLDYVLRRKAVEIREKNENYLSVALLKKACEIMQYSRIAWRINDYMRLVNWLYEDGRFDEAEYYEHQFKDVLFAENSVTKRHRHDIKNAVSMGYDLIKYVPNKNCCLECALRRNRVYSISGNDKRFPKYSEYTCSCYGISIIPFDEERSKKWNPEYDYVKESNRPFIDDRTCEEKQQYQFDCDKKVYEEVVERDRKIFNKMKVVIPNFPFKSFRSYNKKIEEYSETALSYGINTLHTEEENKIIERYLKAKTLKKKR